MVFLLLHQQPHTEPGRRTVDLSLGVWGPEGGIRTGRGVEGGVSVQPSSSVPGSPDGQGLPTRKYKDVDWFLDSRRTLGSPQVSHVLSTDPDSRLETGSKTDRDLLSELKD